MAFEFNDQHIVDYHTLGYTVFRDLIPPALLAELRRQADLGRLIARRVAGGNAQRLQPIIKHPELDMRPFDELDRLPVLDRALRELFASEPGMVVDLSLAREWLGILYEPGESPYCMSWHRDYRDLHPGVDLQKGLPAARPAAIQPDQRGPVRRRLPVGRAGQPPAGRSVAFPTDRYRTPMWRAWTSSRPRPSVAAMCRACLAPCMCG